MPTAPIDLETERLVLRRLTLADLDLYCTTILGDAAVMRMLPGTKAIPLESARPRAWSFLCEHWDQHGFGPWLVFAKQSGQLLGHCGLKYWPASEDVEVLYALTPKAWGQGYATEAARRAVQCGFADLHLPRVIAAAARENAASLGVIGKLGMRYWEDRDFAGLQVKMFQLSRAAWNGT
jgi:[ribosomal protein S5]-alanine N-acetyltransferase